MPESNYVHESGEPIAVGTHGETNFLFHSGDPVPNTGRSDYVFESGVGLGGGDFLLFWTGNDTSNFSGFSGMATEAADVTGLNADHYHRQDYKPLDEVLNEKAYSYIALAFTNGGDGAFLDSAELSALSDWWDTSGQAAALFSEANSETDPGDRAEAADEAAAALNGSLGYDTVDGVTDQPFTGVNCTTYGIPDGSAHPVFSGVSEFARGHTETHPTGATLVDAGSAESVFGYYEEDDGRRIWLDGGWTTVGDDWIDSCSDGRLYARQVCEWMDDQI